MLRPNFLYLGGDKCGSTWIYYILDKHPNVTLARAKELFYFDKFYQKGSGWYNSQFPVNTDALRVGEICHDYLYSEEALQRIAQDMSDDSTFLITVRDPIDRTVSHYKYLRKIGRTDASFADALSSQPQIIEHSMFGKYVALAIKHLGAQRVSVLQFETLKKDPTEFGRSLSKALGLPFDPSLPYHDRILEAGSARNPTVVRILRNIGWVIRKFGAPLLVTKVKQSALVSKLLFTSQKGSQTDGALTEDIRKKLHEMFAEDQALLLSLSSESGSMT